MMLESNIEEGRQENTGDLSTMTYGVSITDPCISWDTTERLLRTAHEQLLRNSSAKAGGNVPAKTGRYSVASGV